MTNEIKNETIDKWAATMALIIHAVDSSVDISLGGMASDDGAYVDADVAGAIVQAFAFHDPEEDHDEEYEVDISEDRNGYKHICIYHRSDTTRGMFVSQSDDEPDMRVLNWYDDSKY